MVQAHGVAQRGWGRTYPNPLVGAVVASGTQWLGSGHHAEFGGIHAEVAALAAAGERSRGATLYVTLEPCAHHGKQPPCTAAIIAAGVARVVIGRRDPNPEAAGGVELLRAAGIQVTIGVDGRSIPDSNFRFHHRFSGLPRPYVAIKLAVSMDGMIADGSGNSRWISGAASRNWVHWLRSGFAAVAAGARTVIADEARLTVRGAVQPRITPVRVIFDRTGTLPPDHVVFEDQEQAPVVVVVGSGVVGARRKALTAAGARLVVADTLPDAMRLLSAEAVDSMLVEGGGRLAGALLRDGLVDRIYQLQCPRWLGEGTPAWVGLGTPALADAARWRVTSVQEFTDGVDETDVLIEMER